MNTQEWERKLREEGFGHTFTWADGPNAFYPDHTHAGTTAHVILDGEMTLTSEGGKRALTKLASAVMFRPKPLLGKNGSCRVPIL